VVYSEDEKKARERYWKIASALRQGVELSNSDGFQERTDAGTLNRVKAPATAGDIRALIQSVLQRRLERAKLAIQKPNKSGNTDASITGCAGSTLEPLGRMGTPV
jgi:hypothetical protein